LVVTAGNYLAILPYLHRQGGEQDEGKASVQNAMQKSVISGKSL
jgi:hypothetical protein